MRCPTFAKGFPGSRELHRKRLGQDGAEVVLVIERWLREEE